MRKLPAVLMGVVVVAAGACGNDSPSANSADDAGTVAHIKVFAFSPNPLKVAAGAKVTWVNDDDITHTVTSGRRTYAPGDTGSVTATEKSGLFDIVLDGPGKRGSHTFAEAGTFHYFCDRHPGMEADVVVSSGSSE
jgi:plastocyanin